VNNRAISQSHRSNRCPFGNNPMGDHVPVYNPKSGSWLGLSGV
jgi:hypothetical protein